MPEPAAPPEAAPVADYFPLAVPREKQIKAMDFITRASAGGYQDIVIAAPTGIGKTGIGVASCLWGVENGAPGSVGGYYLVTQKLLQDQLEHDFSEFINRFSGLGASLKSSIEYPCPRHGTCMVGGKSKPSCSLRKTGGCPYRNAHEHFCAKPVAVTNYPFFMTERTYVKKLPARRVVILDECHTIEKQVLNFVDITVGTKELMEWAPHCHPLPEMVELGEFQSWLARVYLPVLTDRYDMMRMEIQGTKDPKVHKEFQALESHLSKASNAALNLGEDPENWVYWQEPDDSGDLRSTAKPIEASPFTEPLLYHGTTRIFMSAYPGPKKVFCRSLGLDPSKTAWCSLASTFPVENRPIHLFFSGSMGRASINQTLPGLLRMITKIMTRHAGEKGIIHCNSYKLGAAIQAHLAGTEHAMRILYPLKAHQREVMLREHAFSKEPTVLLSPSMTEGFSLDDGLARWQVIAKCPFPYLGDRQVAAKRERDPAWYAMQTAMAIIQACGRIVRSDEDWGATYILDTDFDTLLRRNPDFFPNWFQQAFVWH